MISFFVNFETHGVPSIGPLRCHRLHLRTSIVFGIVVLGVLFKSLDEGGDHDDSKDLMTMASGVRSRHAAMHME